MANAHVQQKRTLKKKNVIVAVLLVLMVQAAVFAYFYTRSENPVSVLLPQSDSGQSAGVSPKPLFGIYGSGSMGSLERPMAVTVYNHKIFVSDTDNHRIAVFDYNGKPLYTFAQEGNGQGQLQFPYGITVDSAGQVYVADLYTSKISVFTQEGKFIKYFPGGDEKIFQKPAGLVFFDNTIFVTDVGLHKVMAFDTNGKMILEFGKKGSGNGELLSPNAVAVTNDFIYLSDTGNNRVEKFDRAGKFLASNTGDLPEGQAGSAFVNNRGIGVDSSDIVYVVSNMTNKLWGFDKDGHKAFEPVGSLGQGNEDFRLPTGLFIDSQGRIYIADTVNKRIMVYQN